MSRAITVWSDSGGVGKTTIALNTASALGRTGDDVLCIDLDPQHGGLTDHCGFQQLLTHDTFDVSDVLLSPDRGLREIVLEGDEVGLDFDLIPANMSLSSFPQQVAASKMTGNDWTILRWELNDSELWADYDVVIVDVPSGRGLLAANSIIATRNVLIPTELSRKGRQAALGLEQYLEELEYGMQRSGNDVNLSIVGAVPNDTGDTNADKRSRERFEEMEIPVTPFEFRHRRALFRDCQDQRYTAFEFAEADETRDLRTREQETLTKFKGLAEVVKQGTANIDFNTRTGEVAP